MSQQTINVGTAPNDGTGTPLRTAFQYTNSNFSELYTAVGPSGNNIVVPGSATITGALAANADTTLGTASKSTNTNLNLSSDLGTQRIYLDRGTRSLVFQDVTSSIENYRIAGITGVHTWGVGGSTAMTLNSTGLGIGGGPSGALDVRGTNSLTYDTSGNLYGLANIGTKGTSGGNLVIQTASATSTFGSALVIDGTYSGLTSTIRFRALGVNSLAYGSQISFSTTASGTIIERMLIDSSGNVGIGVSPAVKLDIGGAATQQFRIQMSGQADTRVISDTGAGIIGTYSNHRLIIRTNSADAVIVDASQNVGIGVQPSAWGGLGTGPGVLQMGNAGCSLLAGGAGFSGTNQFFINNNAYYNAVGGGSFKYYRAGGGAAQYSQVGNSHIWSVSSNTPVADTAITFTQAMTLDAVRGLHVDTTAYVGIGVGVVNAKNGFNIVPDNTGNAANRNWNFATNGSSAGNLDIVVSSANNTYPNFAYRMQLTSAGAAYNTTGTWGTISDSRLKENISDARNYLADLLKLRVVKYSLKEEASAVATKLGLIAQEVEQVFPSLVEQSDVAYDGGDGIRTVKTSVLVPMLLKAIQELTARVQTLETR